MPRCAALTAAASRCAWRAAVRQPALDRGRMPVAIAGANSASGRSVAHLAPNTTASGCMSLTVGVGQAATRACNRKMRIFVFALSSAKINNGRLARKFVRSTAGSAAVDELRASRPSALHGTRAVCRAGDQHAMLCSVAGAGNRCRHECGRSTRLAQPTMVIALSDASG